ncbi:MAG: SH3 domain-containing protein [Treponema sp.]|jgi:hypothetical protein|nr:SH3 domain-containing protein [Treponema sp.]
MKAIYGKGLRFFSGTAAVLFICAAFSLFSCGAGSNRAGSGPDAGEVQEDPGAEETAVAEAGGSFPGKIPWTGPLGVIVSTAYLMELHDDGLMYTANRVLNPGDTVGWKEETIRAKRKSDNVERDFYRIDSDGEDLWVQSYAAAGPGAEPAVIIGENTVLYTRPDLAAPASGSIISIPQYTLAAVFPGMETDLFTCISAYIANTGTVDKRYVKRQNISTDSGDVKSMQLYQLALATTIGLRRRELLNNAREISGSFGSLIGEALADLEGYTEIEESFEVSEDNVNIRDSAGAEGEKTGVLKKGDKITARSRTNFKWQAGGKTDYWYRIPKGWVFGAYLKKAE